VPEKCQDSTDTTDLFRIRQCLITSPHGQLHLSRALSRARSSRRGGERLACNEGGRDRERGRTYPPTCYGWGKIRVSLTPANVPSSVVGNADYVSPWRGVDDDISLRSDAAVGLDVENQDSVKALFGAAGNSLGEIRSACLGSIEFDRKFHIQFRSKNRGSSHGQIPRFGPEPAHILLPILPCMPLSQLDFVRGRIVGIDRKIALICFGRIKSVARRKKHGKNKKERGRVIH
jgi:hypothetical protein